MSGVQPTARSASGSVAMPVTVAAASTATRRGSPRRRRPAVHLRREVGDRPVDEWLEWSAQPLGPRLGSRLSSRTSPSSAGVRTAARNTAHDDRVDAVERIVRRRAHRRLDRRAELRGGLGEHGVDELVLGGEPVQHRLLAHPDGGGDLVERHGVDAASPEQLDATPRGSAFRVGCERRAPDVCLPFGREPC